MTDPAVNYPTSLDSNTTLYLTTNGTDYPQDVHHNALKNAVLALEAKVGITNSAVSTSLDYAVNNKLAKIRIVGGAAFPTIAAALADLPTEGGIVFVPQGTYTLTASLTPAVNNVCILGAGRSTIITTADNDLALITASSKTGLVFSNLRLQGANVAGTGDGILLTGCQNCIIDRIWTTQNGRDGIRLYQSSENIVQAVFALSNLGDGVHLAGDGGGNADYNLITTSISRGNTGNGIEVAGGANANQNLLLSNMVRANTAANIVDGGTSTRIRQCEGWVNENSGTGTIPNAGTSVLVTHGLSATPALQNIRITLGENPSNTPGAIWVDTIGATQFKVNCENDPGASNLDFGWYALIP